MSDAYEIVIKENYGASCLVDKECKDSTPRKPQGFVEVYEVNENGEQSQLVGKSNLVVYMGREWLASRAFNTRNLAIDSSNEEAIYWIGIGSGGAEPLNPLIPIPPNNDNTSLNSEVMLTTTSSPYYGDLRGGGYYKKVLDSVTFEQDIANSNKYLIAKVAATIGSGDAEGSTINEAGLFTAMSGSGGWNGPFHLFARVTFSSIVKTTERRLIFVWYIYV